MTTSHPDHSMISSSSVEGTSIYDPNGNSIGKIDHLMIDKQSGQVRYGVISFGGILGMGKSHHPIPWNAFRYSVERDGFVTHVTADQLRDAPEFSDASWSNRDWETKVHAHYATRPYWDDSGTLGSYGNAPTVPPHGSTLAGGNSGTWERVQGDWKIFKGKVKERWGKLSDDDLEVANGKRDQLLGQIQARYGMTRQEADRQVSDWERTI